MIALSTARRTAPRTWYMPGNRGDATRTGFGAATLPELVLVKFMFGALVSVERRAFAGTRGAGAAGSMPVRVVCAASPRVVGFDSMGLRTDGAMGTTRVEPIGIDAGSNDERGIDRGSRADGNGLSTSGIGMAIGGGGGGDATPGGAPPVPIAPTGCGGV